MLLRWLVGNYVRSGGAAKLREMAASALVAPVGPREAWQTAVQAAAEDPAVALPGCDVAIVFALGVEAGGVVDALDSAVTGTQGGAREHLGLFAKRRTLVLETGVGQAAASAATRAALEFYRPAWVISAGFAGALTGDLPRNRMVLGDEVVTAAGEVAPLTLPFSREEVAATPGLELGRLLTTDKLLRTERERRELGEQQRALACDMETFAVAAACRERGLPCLAIRIISDGVAEALPPEVKQLGDQPNWATKLGTLSATLFRKPGMVQALWELQGRAVAASDRLARFLASVVGQMPV